MSPYAKVNIRETSDLAPSSGLRGIEARFPRRELGCETAAVSLQTFAPGARSAFGHRHERQEELYVVTAGSGRAKLDDEIVDLDTWDVLRVSPGTMRAFEAGPDGLEYLAFGAPIGEERDSELVPGWWS